MNVNLRILSFESDVEFVFVTYGVTREQKSFGKKNAFGENFICHHLLFKELIALQKISHVPFTMASFISSPR